MAANGSSSGGPPRRAGDIAEIASLPLAIGAAVAIGYLAGRWVGTTFFPASAEAWATGGVLYGLAGGFYHAVKVMRRAIARAERDRRARPATPLKYSTSPPPTRSRDRHSSADSRRRGDASPASGRSDGGGDVADGEDDPAPR